MSQFLVVYADTKEIVALYSADAAHPESYTSSRPVLHCVVQPGCNPRDPVIALEDGIWKAKPKPLNSQMVQEKLDQYQKAAPGLLRELYATNTLQGITVAQSDALFDEYQDVIMRLAQGAFPTALYRLAQKAPSGFVTQEMLYKWTLQIQACL